MSKHGIMEFTWWKWYPHRNISRRLPDCLPSARLPSAHHPFSNAACVTCAAPPSVCFLMTSNSFHIGAMEWKLPHRLIHVKRHRYFFSSDVIIPTNCIATSNPESKHFQYIFPLNTFIWQIMCWFKNGTHEPTSWDLKECIFISWILVGREYLARPKKLFHTSKGVGEEHSKANPRTKLHLEAILNLNKTIQILYY